MTSVQSKIVLRCPQKACHGWRDFVGLEIPLQRCDIGPLFATCANAATERPVIVRTLPITSWRRNPSQKEERTTPATQLFVKLGLGKEMRIKCHVCSLRKSVEEWHCFKCNMIRANCICNQPEIAKSQGARKRPATVLGRQVMPAPKTAATCKAQSTVPC